MIQLPDERPEVGPLGLNEDRRAFNQLLRYVKSITPKDSPTVKVNIGDGVGTTFDAEIPAGLTKSPCPYG